MIRVAAVGDVHVGIDSAGRLAPRLAGLAGQADLFLLAGDRNRRRGSFIMCIHPGSAPQRVNVQGD